MLSRKAQVQFDYMRRMAPKRGGFMYEGARLAYDAGKYKDDEIAEMLSAGAIKPHDDPKKGWVVCDDYMNNYQQMIPCPYCGGLGRVERL